MPTASSSVLICACAMTALLTMGNSQPRWLRRQAVEVPLWLPVTVLVVLGMAACGVLLTHPVEIAQAFGQNPTASGYPVVIAMGP